MTSVIKASLWSLPNDYLLPPVESPPWPFYGFLISSSATINFLISSFLTYFVCGYSKLFSNKNDYLAPKILFFSSYCLSFPDLLPSPFSYILSKFSTLSRPNTLYPIFISLWPNSCLPFPFSVFWTLGFSKWGVLSVRFFLTY